MKKIFVTLLIAFCTVGMANAQLSKLKGMAKKAKQAVEQVDKSKGTAKEAKETVKEAKEIVGTFISMINQNHMDYYSTSIPMDIQHQHNATFASQLFD